MEARREENRQKVMLTEVQNGEVKVALMSKGTKGENGLHFKLSSYFGPNNNGVMLLKDGHLKIGPCLAILGIQDLPNLGRLNLNLELLYFLRNFDMDWAKGNKKDVPGMNTAISPDIRRTHAGINTESLPIGSRD